MLNTIFSGFESDKSSLQIYGRADLKIMLNRICLFLQKILVYNQIICNEIGLKVLVIQGFDHHKI